MGLCRAVGLYLVLSSRSTGITNTLHKSKLETKVKLVLVY
jgi:hypothetical protein